MCVVIEVAVLKENWFLTIVFIDSVVLYAHDEINEMGTIVEYLVIDKSEYISYVIVY